MLTHREPEDRHDAIFTAASPVPRQPQWGFLGFFKGSREAQ
jgi:hypothetical protein